VTDEPTSTEPTDLPLIQLLDVETPKGRRVVVTITSDRHSTMFELAPARAIAAGEALATIGRQAASGLIVANEVPNGHRPGAPNVSE